MAVAPTIKHLFQGFDVTLFAYGVTGSGKTHTMRGGKTLADRGMIPRMLSNIYRKSRALEKSSNGETTVNVSMSYYEIYTDKVFDLFEPPEKRTPTGLPIREAEGGKTVVAGLSEVPCSTLKEFEELYDKANANRSVGATKLNAQSSRSHAILCVKVIISTATETRISTMSAIDLAGSEDNRRTGNVKERMVESASINKSLFVLAQCVEAISKKQARIPYRESKMTRILGLGQNNGLTVMILNLPPTKAFHLDTLSSLNFANRTKKIEVREIENEPIFKGPPRPPSTTTMNRQPLRPLSNMSTNANILANKTEKTEKDKPIKQFSVYADKSKKASTQQAPQKSSPLKRTANDALLCSRPLKQAKASLIRGPSTTQTITTASLDALVEKKVSEILAAREQNAHSPIQEKAISAEVQARLDSIERRLEGQEGERAEGLSYLFMAKQHQARGEDASALKMYKLAQPFFPTNEKLEKKIEKLRAKITEQRRQEAKVQETELKHEVAEQDVLRTKKQQQQEHVDESYQEADTELSYHDTSHASYNDSEHTPQPRKRTKRSTKSKKIVVREDSGSPDPLQASFDDGRLTPRTSHILDVLNSKNMYELKGLSGLGTKKAEAIVQALNEDVHLQGWGDVIGLEVKGIGKKTWEAVRTSLIVQ